MFCNFPRKDVLERNANFFCNFPILPLIWRVTNWYSCNWFPLLHDYVISSKLIILRRHYIIGRKFKYLLNIRGISCSCRSTRLLTVLKPWNPSIGVSWLHKIGWSTDYETLKWSVRWNCSLFKRSARLITWITYSSIYFNSFSFSAALPYLLFRES